MRTLAEIKRLKIPLENINYPCMRTMKTRFEFIGAGDDFGLLTLCFIRIRSTSYMNIRPVRDYKNYAVYINKTNNKPCKHNLIDWEKS